jgi:hypothetical protein
MDLVIFAGWLVACGFALGFIAWISKRAVVDRDPPSPVPVAMRLQDDHRRRVQGTHVSAVRPSDPRLARWELSPQQKHAIAQGKKRKTD